jgi:2-polyprenyl-3-methyl-5-hydroxy-6-metoxy-1,4-benzoquinol methylase
MKALSQSRDLRVFQWLPSSLLHGTPLLARYQDEQTKPHASFVCSTIEDCDLSGPFDNVFLINVLEHVDDSVLVLKRIAALMSDRSRLFLAVPNANSPSRSIAVLMGLISHNAAVTEGEFKHGHRRTYTIDTLLQDVREAGLTDIFTTGVFFKSLANYQLDKCYETEIVSDAYFDACMKYGQLFPSQASTLLLVCERSN